MTAPVAVPLEDRFGPATEALNAWRGRCMACFARAEAAVSEALVALGPTDGKAVLPLLVGQRFATLAARLEARGDASGAVAAIRTFAPHDEVRAFLCHGDSRILIDRRGRWQAIFTLVAPSRDVITRRFLLVDADEAEAIAHDLQRDQQRMGAQLGRLTPAAIAGADRKAALRIGGSHL